MNVRGREGEGGEEGVWRVLGWLGGEVIGEYISFVLNRLYGRLVRDRGLMVNRWLVVRLQSGGEGSIGPYQEGLMRVSRESFSRSSKCSM